MASRDPTARKRDPLEVLLEAATAEMNIMTAVATGGPKIAEVQAEYLINRRVTRALVKKFGFDDPNPYDDLWDWYGYWTRELGTWQSRRGYIRELYKPLLSAINDYGSVEVGSGLPGADLEGWDQVEQQVQLLKVRLSACDTPEDAQAVGLLCRDIMISVAQASYDTDTHGQTETESAVEQLDAVIDYHAGGKENAKLRRLGKTTIDYANTVQHRRDGILEEAGIVAEATVAAVSLIRRIIELPGPE